MKALVVLAVSIGIFLLLIIWTIKISRKANARKLTFYLDLARKYKLNHSFSKHNFTALNVLEGMWNGMPFIIYEQMQGSGKNQTLVTIAVIEDAPFDFDFRIGKEHLFSKAGKLLGMNDIEFGDNEFDSQFLIKAENEDRFRSFFNYKLQAELSNLKKDLKAPIKVKKGAVNYTQYGPITNTNDFKSFEKVVDFMFQLIKEAERGRS